MNDMLKVLLSLSVSGTVLLFLVWVITKMGEKKLSKTWQYYVWLLVVIRLLIPVSIGDSLVGSAFKRIPDRMADSAAALMQNAGQSAMNPDPFKCGIVQIPVEETAEQDQQTADIGFASILVILWGTIAVTLAVLRMSQYRRLVASVCVRQAALTDSSLLKQLRDACQELGIKNHVELYENFHVRSPFIVGLFRPRIVLPSKELTAEEFRYILLHELTHYRRGDQMYKWLMQTVLCVHWFNPAVHWLVFKVNRACELACDEAVIRRLDGTETYEYGNLLIDFLQQAANKTGYHQLGHAFAQDSIAVKERLKSMMTYQKSSKTTIVTAVVITLALIGVALTLGAFTPEVSFAESAPTSTDSPSVMQQAERMPKSGDGDSQSIGITSETVVYYNPDGGRYYHLSAVCESVRPKYLKKFQSISYGKLSNELPALAPCEYCFVNDYHP